MRADLGQNEDNKNAKNSIKAANSNICVEAENDRRITGLACATAYSGEIRPVILI
jgi:hypothetical protein